MFPTIFYQNKLILPIPLIRHWSGTGSSLFCPPSISGCHDDRTVVQVPILVICGHRVGNIAHIGFQDWVLYPTTQDQANRDNKEARQGPVNSAM